MGLDFTGWVCSSVVQLLPIMHKALASIPSTAKRKKMEPNSLPSEWVFSFIAWYVAEMAVYDSEDIIKGIVISSLFSLVVSPLWEIHCHDVRTLKELCGQVHVAKN